MSAFRKQRKLLASKDSEEYVKFKNSSKLYLITFVGLYVFPFAVPSHVLQNSYQSLAPGVLYEISSAYFSSVE